jgi:hypothetical protein
MQKDTASIAMRDADGESGMHGATTSSVKLRAPPSPPLTLTLSLQLAMGRLLRACAGMYGEKVSISQKRRCSTHHHHHHTHTRATSHLL